MLSCQLSHILSLLIFAKEIEGTTLNKNTSNMANVGPNQSHLVPLGGQETWNIVDFPVMHVKTFTKYDKNNSYAQRFKTVEDAEHWEDLMERTLAAIHTTKRLRSQKDCLHVYHAILLKDYIPKLLHRYGYSRIPKIVSDAIVTLEGYDRNHDREYHFWNHVPAPITPPAHQNNPIPPEVLANMGTVSDSDNSDMDGEDN